MTGKDHVRIRPCRQFYFFVKRTQSHGSTIFWSSNGSHWDINCYDPNRQVFQTLFFHQIFTICVKTPSWLSTEKYIIDFHYCITFFFELEWHVSHPLRIPPPLRIATNHIDDKNQRTRKEDKERPSRHSAQTSASVRPLLGFSFQNQVDRRTTNGDNLVLLPTQKQITWNQET